VAPGGTVLALPPPMYRQEEPRSKVFVVQATSESISPENGAPAGLEKPAPPQAVVPAAVVYLSDMAPMVVVVVLDVVVVAIVLVVDAAVDVVVVAIVLVVDAAVDVVVVAAAVDVVVVAAPVVEVVAAPVVVVVGAPVVVVVAAPVVVVVGAPVVEVVAAPVVVVVGADVVVVVPPPPAQPLGPHASQQLGTDPTHADPPRGGLQADALLLIEQLVSPPLSVRQQVTKPGLPQVDCDSQFITAPEHWGRSDPFSTASSVTISTHST